MNEFELKEQIKTLEHKLEQYELANMGIYAPRHVLNTKSEFGKAIKENLKQQKSNQNHKTCFIVTEQYNHYWYKTLTLNVRI